MSKITYLNKTSAVDPLNPSIPTEVIQATDLNEIKASVNALYDALTYKSFVFQLTQSGTSDPTMATLFNNTGLTFTVQRAGVGAYLITPSAPPAQNKTAYFGGATAISLYYDGDFINVNTSVDGVATDSALAANPFEFRIYP